MRHFGILVVAMVFLMAGMPDAQAAPQGRCANVHQHKQEQRIRQGVKSGELTRNEALRLQHGERKLNRQERAFRADGHVTRQERLKLMASKDRLNRQIYLQKHDRQDRD